MNTTPSLPPETPETDADGGEIAHDLCAATPAVGPWPACEDRETAHAYFARLIDQRDLTAAARFAAVWLGPRRAVWWGCLCAWNRLREIKEPNEHEAAAIDAAVHWVLTREEDARRAAGAATELAGLKCAAGAVAAAAFWSGGSVSLPDRPDVPPPAGVCAKLIANAVQMAAASPSAAQREATLVQSLRLAAEAQASAAPWSVSPVEASFP